MASKSKILQLYKNMLRESGKIPSYNFREYAIRRTRYAFKENKLATDPKVQQSQIEQALHNLEIIKRQAIIGQLYSVEKLVIEH